MNTIELFAGKKSFSKVAQELGHTTFTIDLNPNLEPDWCVDLDLINLANIEIKQHDIFWASPPCTAFSIASIGKHWNKSTGSPKTKEAELGLRLLDKTIQWISKEEPKKWYIENPRGMMRKKIDKIFKKYGIKKYRRVTISYCQYGDKRMKPTDIWTNDFDWIPRKMCRPKDTCHEQAPRGSRTGTQGLANARERGIIPRELFLEILGKQKIKQEVLL